MTEPLPPILWPTCRVKIQAVRATSLLPIVASADAVGHDVHADIAHLEGDPNASPLVEDGRTWIPPHVTAIIPLGIRLEIPRGICGWLKGRSGAAAGGSEAHFAAIDPDYRGELTMIVHGGSIGRWITQGERVGQLIFTPAFRAEFEVARELSKTARGEGGLGSTGK